MTRWTVWLDDPALTSAYTATVEAAGDLASRDVRMAVAKAAVRYERGALGRMIPLPTQPQFAVAFENWVDLTAYIRAEDVADADAQPEPEPEPEPEPGDVEAVERFMACVQAAEPPEPGTERWARACELLFSQRYLALTAGELRVLLESGVRLGGGG